jgi:hypothetical protein
VADAARMHFEWCFGTFVPPLDGASIVFRQEPAQHEDDVTPAAGTYSSLKPCVRVASAAPGANLKRRSRTRDTCGQYRRLALPPIGLPGPVMDGGRQQPISKPFAVRKE